MKVILIGAGGHARSCISCLKNSDIAIAGFLDRPERIGEVVGGVPIVGTDSDIEALVPTVDCFLVTVGQKDTGLLRKTLFDRVISARGSLAKFVAADASVDSTVVLGQGTIVMRRATLNSGVVIGVNCIINTGAIVEHDVIVGDHVHISTGGIVNGGCRVGNGVFLGSGAILRDQVSIADDVLIGAGSVVIKDITEPGTYVGNPARRLK